MALVTEELDFSGNAIGGVKVEVFPRLCDLNGSDKTFCYIRELWGPGSVLILVPRNPVCSGFVNGANEPGWDGFGFDS